MTTDQLQNHLQYLNLLLRRESAKPNPDRTQIAKLLTDKDETAAKIGRMKKNGSDMKLTLPLCGGPSLLSLYNDTL